jgi:putative DNA methylase
MSSPHWHSRGYLPHFEAGDVPQSITFRLADSLPTVLLRQLESELKLLPESLATRELRKRTEYALDQGHGEMHLAHPDIAQLVENALLHFDGERCAIHAWCIMPNHVHVLATPKTGHVLSAILQSWKSFTAKKANEIIRRHGKFWAPEYHDRYIRDELHYHSAISYIALNPVKAGLCRSADKWRFSSSWKQRDQSGQDARDPR